MKRILGLICAGALLAIGAGVGITSCGGSPPGRNSPGPGGSPAVKDLQELLVDIDAAASRCEALLGRPWARALPQSPAWTARMAALRGFLMEAGSSPGPAARTHVANKALSVLNDPNGLAADASVRAVVSVAPLFDQAQVLDASIRASVAGLSATGNVGAQPQVDAWAEDLSVATWRVALLGKPGADDAQTMKFVDAALRRAVSTGILLEARAVNCANAAKALAAVRTEFVRVRDACAQTTAPTPAATTLLAAAQDGRNEAKINAALAALGRLDQPSIAAANALRTELFNAAAGLSKVFALPAR